MCPAERSEGAAEKPSHVQRRSAKFGERGFHFRPGMLIADALGHGDAGAEHLFSFLRTSQPGQELSELLIAGHVVGVVGQELTEMLNGRVMVATV